MTDGLDALARGRVHAVDVVPETGLLVLTVGLTGRTLRLGVGVGPRLVGLGWLPHAPGYTASRQHPLAAALRARVVGETVRSVTVDPDDGAVWLAVGERTVSARVRMVIALRGDVTVLGPLGETVLLWQGDARRSPRSAEIHGEMDAAGEELVRLSDGLAGELRRSALRDVLKAALRRYVRRTEAVRGDLERLEGAPRLQRIGRRLLAQGDGIPRGVTEATLDDWEEGGTLTVDLDPARPAKMQAAGLFAQARRIQRGESVMRARLAETEETLEKLRALATAVDDAPEVTPEALETWWTHARTLGVVRGEKNADGKVPPGQGAKRAEARVPYLEYTASLGRRVLVGRGAKDNDALTLSVARPQDLWLHARGVAGAHVVVPMDRGAQCPPEVLVDAATLAAHHSDARGETTVEVTWTEKRYVRKPKKLPPGKVVTDREHVLTLRLEAPRLDRLLASRRT